MSEQNSFIIYHDQRSTFEALRDEEIGQIIRAMFKHELGEEFDETFSGNRLLEVTFKPISETLKRNRVKYVDRCKQNSENAKKRWENKIIDATAYECMQMNANHADSDRERESDRESDRGSEYITSNRTEIFNAFKAIWDTYPNTSNGEEPTDELIKTTYGLYTQYFEGVECNGKIQKFGTIEIELYIQDYIKKFKEECQEAYLPILKDVLEFKLIPFIENGIV